MPTPFQHLVYAMYVLEDARLPAFVRELLRNNRAAFYLGNTAADVQTLTKQPRIETHFYHLADIGSLRPTEVLLTTYPQLACPQALSVAHAAFLSGYLVHLTWDEMWASQVFIPHYVHSGLWEDRLSRSKHHNGLRVLLDRQAQVYLQAHPRIAEAVSAANPQGWLPFVPDVALCQWRDWLSLQLADPAKVETGAVFAKRMGITHDEMNRIVQQMASGHYPPHTDVFDIAVRHFEPCAQWAGVQALTQYWAKSGCSDSVALK